jgi:ubiquinone/menaquinone biosynthesis C-methylase UbiE
MEINVNKINKFFYNSKKQVSYYDNNLISLEKPEEILFNKFIHVDSRVLDIGCGAGRTTFHISKITNNVIGIDYAENMIQAAKQKYTDMDFRVMDATKMEFPNNSFDVLIFSYNGICCIFPESKRIRALLEIKRVLNNNGVFIYSILNKYSPYSFSSFLNTVISIPFLGFSSNYKFHLTRTGLMLLYENKPKYEIEILNKMNFEFLELHPSESMVKVFSVQKPVWSYFAFKKIS